VRARADVGNADGGKGPLLVSDSMSVGESRAAERPEAETGVALTRRAAPGPGRGLQADLYESIFQVSPSHWQGRRGGGDPEMTLPSPTFSLKLEGLFVHWCLRLVESVKREAGYIPVSYADSVMTPGPGPDVTAA
jgi:hypothetical protein